MALAAGNSFTLDIYGDRLITLAVDDQIARKVIDVATGKPLKSLVTNDGKIKANGGRVELTAAAARHVVNSVINTSGVIKANSIGTRNGMIVLSAATAATKPAGAPTQTIRISGTVSAAGKKKGTTGGTIVVTGEDIQLANARIDASGRDGGGKVLIGGDWGGGNPDLRPGQQSERQARELSIPTATTVSVDAGTTINASAERPRQRRQGDPVVGRADDVRRHDPGARRRAGRRRRVRGDVGASAARLHRHGRHCARRTARGGRRHRGAEWRGRARCCSILQRDHQQRPEFERSPASGHSAHRQSVRQRRDPADPATNCRGHHRTTGMPVGNILSLRASPWGRANNTASR